MIGVPGPRQIKTGSFPEATCSPAEQTKTHKDRVILNIPAPLFNKILRPAQLALQNFKMQPTCSKHPICNNKITTLVTFELPEQYANNQCQLVFDFGSDSSSSVTGTGKAQLFTSLAPADQDTSTWPSGNLRNQNLGTIQVNAYGRATWEAGSGPGASADGKFACSAIAGKIYGGEVVPVGDADTISWAAGLGDGPKILVW